MVLTHVCVLAVCHFKERSSMAGVSIGQSLGETSVCWVITVSFASGYVN